MTLALFGILLSTEAPHWWRLVVFAPSAAGAAGYLQAAGRFCADYGWRGVFNFGEAGHSRTTSVADAGARRADRIKALQIALGSALVGLVVAVGAFLV